MKCQNCHNKPATVHLTEIEDGQKIEKHLCEDCAAAEGIAIKADVPISKLLEDLILHGPQSDQASAPALSCDVCGCTFKDFQKEGHLGCPHDYDAFEEALEPVIRRAQGGASEHVGKVPRRAGSDEKKHNAILRLRAELKTAIAEEDYERAASIRDQIKEYETL
jgi:protein arginine kinase activator